MRNAEFDRQQVLRQAMNAFIDKGYAKTSMQDLTKATGLHPGSIYCAFDNKQGLLLAVIEQYGQDRHAELTACFSSSLPFVEQLKRYLTGIVDECLCEGTPKACLLTKALNEVAEQDESIRDAIKLHLDGWQQTLEAQFEQAIVKGEIKGDGGHLARYFIMGIYGLRTFAHTKPAPEVLHALAQQLLQDTCRS
ncbi:TetR/AcrR family transcriptional regulator [Shewanella marisflavi]|uniref:TetR/AcrR family transcriptional regulator n=1 Tax=Shewanella TaxID=22 RepID=UPI003AAAECB5